MLIHTTKPVQSRFGEAPETFNAIDMGSASDEFVLAMIHPQVFAISDIDQAIVAPPSIGVDDAIQGDTTSDNPLERRLSAVWNDFCVDRSIALENTKHSRFTVSAASSLTFDAPGTEVGLIDFNLTRERRLKLAIFSNAFTDAAQIPVDGIAVVTREFSDLSGVQIQRKQPDNMPKLGLTNSCTVCIPVFHRHDSSLASLH